MSEEIKFKRHFMLLEYFDTNKIEMKGWTMC